MSIELVRAVPNSSHGQDDNLTRALVQFRVLRFRIHEFAKAISDTNAVKGRVERADELPVSSLGHEAGLETGSSSARSTLPFTALVSLMALANSWMRKRRTRNWTSARVRLSS